MQVKFLKDYGDIKADATEIVSDKHGALLIGIGIAEADAPKPKKEKKPEKESGE